MYFSVFLSLSFLLPPLSLKINKILFKKLGELQNLLKKNNRVRTALPRKRRHI